MIIFGADIHPVYQAGIPIEQLPGAGIDFLSVKVSQGTSSVYLSQGSLSMIHRALAVGILVVGYHWLEPGNEQAQAATFAAALNQAGISAGVSDVEDITSTHAPTLNIAGIRSFHDSCAAHGAHVAFMYLPHWYWQAIGSPNLTGLPMLWASSYPSSRAGSLQDLYTAVDSSRWQAYGGLSVGPLQFASTAIVAGYQPVDVNAFQGNRAEFAGYIGYSPRKKGHSEMDQLPATPMPVDVNSDPAKWPQRVWDIGFDLAGGWEGEFAYEFGVQDWGGRTVDAVRGFLAMASWRTPTGLVPVSPDLAAGGKGQVIYDHTPTVALVAPHGATALVVNYAAPGGAYVTEGRSD
jgi:hypothetical protein